MGSYLVFLLVAAAGLVRVATWIRSSGLIVNLTVNEVVNNIFDENAFRAYARSSRPHDDAAGAAGRWIDCARGHRLSGWS
jgi:hypothetical protein